jgi:GxxExxY protein
MHGRAILGGVQRALGVDGCAHAFIGIGGYGADPSHCDVLVMTAGFRCARSTAEAQTNADDNKTNADVLLEEELTGRIISAFFKVYDVLGFGFLESVYRRALAHELRKRGMTVECEVVIDVWYESQLVGHFKADMIVEKKVLIENKASLHVVEADRKQHMNYLRATNIEIGLLLHFGPRAGFQRVAYSNRAKPPRTYR